MHREMRANGFGKRAPVRREGKQQGIAPQQAAIGMRSMQQPVVHDGRITAAQTERDLSIVVAEGRVVGG